MAYGVEFALGSEVFRFGLVRPPKKISKDNSTIIPIHLPSDETNEFITALRAAKSSGNRDGMKTLALEFSQSINFVNLPQKIDPKFRELAFIVRDNLQKSNDSYFKENFERIFSPDDANTVINSDDYKRLFEHVTNSIITCAILSNIASTVKSLNVFVVYALDLIKQLATNSLNSAKINDSTIIIPRGIFPLPLVKDNSDDDYKKEKERRKKLIDEARRKLEETAQFIQGNKNAINELINVFQRSTADERKKGQGFILSEELSSKISASTKEILTRHGLSTVAIDLSKSVAVMEKSNKVTTDKLRKNITSGTRMIKMGSVLLPADYFSSDFLPAGHEAPTCSKTPGVCPPVPIIEEPEDEITTPVGHGQAHAYGFSDLMVVEQNLSHYDLGEIAHIENVLKSEIRSRELRTTKTREESELTETEETSEKTEDLSTTEKFELGTESQNVINENRSTDIGVTVNASYGPSVDITANFNHSSSTSTQDSKSASTNFARDTTTRAINRLEKRKLHRRFVRTVEEVMELNKHDFKNDIADADDISGIYRWVDKIYELQIINYGKRFMLEFIIPEPAAFFRYTMSKMPDEVNTLIKPDPPGYCDDDGKTFHLLQVEDITRECYTDFVSKYNVQDVNTPPHEFITISQANAITPEEIKSINIPPVGDIKFGHAAKQAFIDIPDGYIPSGANVNLQWAEFKKTLDLEFPPEIYIQIQDRQIIYPKDTGTAEEPNEKEIDKNGWANVSFDPQQPTPAVHYTMGLVNMFYGLVNIDILCFLSDVKYSEWQLKTYTAIMNAYNAEKSRYDDAIQTIKIRTGFSEIKGKNPLYNREIEKLELKRGCISIVTAQRFSAFDAIKKNVAPYGYPEIVNFDEVHVDGEYIRRFEQAFEWNNMTYVFYPYFWGNKEDWVMVSKLDDTDPLFARFLQAGAARVLIPVRPGFEKTIIDYLEIEEEWNADGTIITEGDETDPLNISIVDEIKSQTGNNSVDGKGTLKVNKDSKKVFGTDTEFSENDINRRIIIKGKTYIIKKIESKTEIILRSKYLDDDDDDVIYSLEGILVGQPWKVRLPTSLVKLDSNISIG